MVFSGLVFLFRFLPCVMLIYYIVPGCMKNTWKNLVLFISSLLFYAWGEPIYVVLMIFSTIVDYINGRLTGYFISRGEKKKALVFVVLSIVINLLLLGTFKYLGMVVRWWNKLTGMSVNVVRLALPVGISFYTFQTMSYTIDVYRGQAKPEKNIISFGTYVALFPQLIAGPIVRFKDISEQLGRRRIRVDALSYGAVRFTVGLGKKVLLANQAGKVFDSVTSYGAGYMTAAAAWLGILFFAFQIYFDFSGYSDMAIGLMSMFGFKIPENFRYPYESKSITEFWRRWHISLGTWFREYVYYPLGGNRKGKTRTLFNIVFVWFLTGLWHGASVNFIAWGCYFCIFIIIEKLGLLKLLEKLPKWQGHLYALLVIYFGWLLFAWQDIPFHRLYIKGMLGMNPAGLVSRETMYLLVSNALLLVVLIFGSTHFPKKLADFICKKSRALKIVLETVFILTVFLLSVAYIVNDTYNPFLYFRF